MSKDFNKVFELIRQDAENKKYDAGMGGEMGDRGAANLLENLEYFRCGLRGELPPQWKKYWDEAQAKADPEYAEYERLKRKFSDR